MASKRTKTSNEAASAKQKTSAHMTPCSQCGEGMNPAEVMLGPVCGRCCRKNQRRVTGR